MNGKRIAPMKGKKRKMVDLPEGARPRKGRIQRKHPLADALSDCIESTQQTHTLKLNNPTPEETPVENVINPYEDHLVIKRALETPLAEEIPESVKGLIHLIEAVQAKPVSYLQDLFHQDDLSGLKGEFYKDMLRLAILVTKIQHGQCADIVTEHVLSVKNKAIPRTDPIVDQPNDQSPESETNILHNPNIQKTIEERNNMENTNKALNVQTATPATPAEFDINKLFENHVREVSPRSRGVAALSAMGVSLLAGAAEMLITGDTSKGAVVKMLGSSALAGTAAATMVDMANRRDMSTLGAAGVGAGVGVATSVASCWGFVEHFLMEEEKEPASE